METCLVTLVVISYRFWNTQVGNLVGTIVRPLFFFLVIVMNNIWIGRLAPHAKNNPLSWASRELWYASD